jgi:hypothetical protein
MQTERGKKINNVETMLLYNVNALLFFRFRPICFVFSRFSFLVCCNQYKGEGVSLSLSLLTGSLFFSTRQPARRDRLAKIAARPNSAPVLL